MKEDTNKANRLKVLEDKIMKSKIMKSKTFENPLTTYGTMYKFDDFHIAITGGGDAGVMHKGFEVEQFTKEEVRVIINKKIKELSSKFFGERK